MKRLLTMVACAALVLMPAAARAQAGAAAGQAKPAGEEKVAQGTVSAMAGETLTVKVKDKEMKFTVDDKTAVIARGAGTASRYARGQGRPGVTLAEVVKVGQNVEVEYSEQTMRAASVRVIPATPGSASDDRPRPIAGTVTAVTGTSMTVKASEGEMTFTVDDKTEIVAPGGSTTSRQKKEAGQKTAITDFVGTGDAVMVRFSDAAGSKLATHIRVTKKAAAK